MEDFIELGIEGADKLVDKHFDKVPDKYMHSQTYNPKDIRRRRRSRRNPQSQPSESDSTQDMSQDPRQYPATYPAPPPPEYTYMPYSREQPHMRPEYAPSPPPVGQPYFPPPPPSQWDPRQEQRYDGDSDDDGEYSDRRAARRPRAITRRSSSYHGPRSRDDDGYGDGQLVQRRRRGTSHDGSGMMSKSRDVAHRYGLKEEVEGFFTKSPAGVTGGLAGALVGGWAAKKAQVAKGKDSNALLTLLGAAAGGLAVNAVIDKFEDRKKETAEKEEAWEEKFGRPEDREISDDEDRKGRRDSGHRHRRRHRSRSSSGDRY